MDQVSSPKTFLDYLLYLFVRLQSEKSCANLVTLWKEAQALFRRFLASMICELSKTLSLGGILGLEL